jgi:hypothetical protein
LPDEWALFGGWILDVAVEMGIAQCLAEDIIATDNQAQTERPG